ncbi:unnamed protein product, partial [Staurois parvus]
RTLRRSETLLDHLCGNQGHCGDQGHCGNQGHCWATCVAIRDTAWPLRRYCWATFVTIRDTAWPTAAIRDTAWPLVWRSGTLRRSGTLWRSGTLLGHYVAIRDTDNQGHCWATCWAIRATCGQSRPLVGDQGHLWVIRDTWGNQGHLWAIRATCGAIRATCWGDQGHVGQSGPL